MLSCNSWWATLHWDSTASCTASQHISSCLTRGHRAASAWLDACAEFADPLHGAALQSTRPWRGRRHTTSSDVLESDTHAAGSHTIQTGSRLPLLQLFPIRGQDTSTCQPIRLFCRRPPRLLLLSLSASAVILNLPRPPLVLLSSSLRHHSLRLPRPLSLSLSADAQSPSPSSSAALFIAVLRQQSSSFAVSLLICVGQCVCESECVHAHFLLVDHTELGALYSLGSVGHYVLTLCFNTPSKLNVKWISYINCIKNFQYSGLLIFPKWPLEVLKSNIPWCKKHSCRPL